MTPIRHRGLPITTLITKITLSFHHNNPGYLIRPQMAGSNSPGDSKDAQDEIKADSKPAIPPPGSKGKKRPNSDDKQQKK